MHKKSFVNALSPAMQFISTPQENEAAEEINGESPNVPMKPNPLYIETKSKRVQLLMQPSTYNKIKEIAEAQNKSFNEIVNQILIDYSK